MIYILIPNEVDSFFQIRVFDSFAIVESIMREGAIGRANPDWCRVFAYVIGLDEFMPCWKFTVTQNHDIKREAIR